jgi:hypothetical protein
VIGYASRTGTRKNLDALREAGWRLIVSATGRHNNHGFKFAIDNGAWTAHQQKQPFDSKLFRELLESHGARADWIAIPDIVAGGLASLEFSRSWLSELEDFPRLLLPVQDGMTPADVRSLIGPRIGIFVGGTTEWKEQSLAIWGELKRETGCWLHVGRVNSCRRIVLCQDAQADSFDGTSATRFSKTLRRLDNTRRQPSLWSSQ